MQNVCVVFDIGKTNKKCIVFNDKLEKVEVKSVIIGDILDEDGESCDDLLGICDWLNESLERVKSSYTVKAVNFVAYEAAIVYLDAQGQPIAPIYNYLKRFPSDLNKAFYEKYGPCEKFCKAVSSPNMGLLNIGLQYFWLKNQKPNIFKNVKYALHLAQYLSSIFTKKYQMDFTTLGCHTSLWDFEAQAYHPWLADQHIDFANLPIIKSSETTTINNVLYGPGMYDDTAAVIPYWNTQTQPFILISTGTWNVSFNPFNTQKLSDIDLKNECLDLLSADGKPIRAAKLFAGNEHERQVKHLAAYFNVELDYYKTIAFDFKTIMNLRKNHKQVLPHQTEIESLRDCPFVERNLNAFKSFKEAYHQFIMDMVAQQTASVKLTFGNQVPHKIFVDGGFAQNEIYMNLLAEAFPNIQVYASTFAQASALGAAMVINWTDTTLTEKNLLLTRY